MAHRRDTFIETPGGARRPLPAGASARLVALVSGALSDAHVRAYLDELGVSVTSQGARVRVSAGALQRALIQAAETLPGAPAELRRRFTSRDLAPDALRALAAALARGLKTGGDVLVISPVISPAPTPPPPNRASEERTTDAPERAALRAVPRPHDPVDALLAMEDIQPEDAHRLLAAIEEMLDVAPLRPATLERTVIPLLDYAETRELAARLLGRAGIQAAVPALRLHLSHDQPPATRLALLSALMRLGHATDAMRTLRSIVLHGSPSVRAAAVATACEAATATDVSALASLAPLVADAPAVSATLAARRFALGELSAFGTLRDLLESVNPATEAGEAEGILRAVARLNSSRLVPTLRRYAEREQRSWLRRRASALAETLARGGDGGASPEELLERAELAAFSEAPDPALAAVDELEMLGAATSRAVYLKATSLKDKGLTREALEASEQALRLSPPCWRAHRLRGSLLYDLDRHDEALESYDRALAAHPTDPYTWYYKGYVLYRLRRDDEALPCLDRALSLKPDSVYIHNQRAFCLERLERFEEAAQAYRRSLKLRPADLAVRDYLGQALHAQGLLAEALETFEAVLDAEPQRTDVLYHRADVLYDLKRWEAAAEAFDAYLRLRPQSYNAWFNRGLCHRFLDDYQAAVSCFVRAVALRPESAAAHRYLADSKARAESGPSAGPGAEPPAPPYETR